MLSALAFVLMAAGLPAMGAGYGAIDAPRPVTPPELARLFCDGRVSGDMSALQPYLSPNLRRLVEDRADIPWQGRPEHPQSCTTEVVNGYADTIGVLVRLTYSAGAVSWSDTLNFDRTPDSWQLNNVFFEAGGNLRFRLFQGS